MTLRPHVHVITPGDHFSPSTGSAVPTVVDGLCRGDAPAARRARVLVTSGTYEDRYPSAEAVEYDPPSARRSDRYTDALAGRLGLPRLGIRRVLAAALAQQQAWEPSVVFGHNLPQLVPLLDNERHVGLLYAHNDVLRSYTRREAERVLGSVAGIVAVSSFLAEGLRGQLPKGLADRVRVVVNGVDCELFRPDPERRRGDVLEVAVVARMVPEKGADVLVEAMRRLARPDIALTVVGSYGFDSRAPLTAYERNLRSAAAVLPGPVRFVPFVPRAELAALLRRMDVLVVPSRWPEPLSLTVKEGLATGVAVVGSRIGGIPEAMGDAGILVAPDDPPALAAVLESLADDEVRRADLASGGRAYAMAHDWAWAARELNAALAPLV